MCEIWRDINGFEGLYQVSNLGRVKRLYLTQPGYIRKQVSDKDGYKKVRLSKNNVATNHFVHRLVASAFLENPHDYPVVNHKDENRANNNVENLEWCSVQYNTRYNNAHKKRVGSLCKPILQLSLSEEFIAKWKCRSDIEKELGYCGSVITACCLGYRGAKTAYGYKWRYIDGGDSHGEKYYAG